MSRKYNMTTRIGKAYDAYLRNRKKWEDKGYSMDEPLPRKEFEQYYKAELKKGKKNVAREFASADRQYAWSSAKKAYNLLQTKEGPEYDEIKKKYSSVKSIVGIDKRKDLFDAFMMAGLTRDEFESIYD